MNRQELSAASSIGLLYLIRMLGLFMVLPVLPIQAQHIQGYTPFLVGVAIGIYGLSQGILQIPFGMLSDRFGRKPLIVIGLILFVLGSFIAGQAEDMTWLIIGRLLQGCGAIASTLLALMSDLTRVDQRSKSMAIIGIGIAASFGLALILGPLIVTTHGLAGVFNLTGILGMAGLLILLFVIPTPTLASVNLDASVQRSRLSKVIGDHGLWRVNVSVFLLHYMLISGFSVFPLLFQMTGQIPDNDHAFYYLVMLVVSFVLMSPLCGWQIG
jgi:MFS family permease